MEKLKQEDFDIYEVDRHTFIHLQDPHFILAPERKKRIAIEKFKSIIINQIEDEFFEIIEKENLEEERIDYFGKIYIAKPKKKNEDNI